MYTSGTVWGPVLCLGRIFVGSAPGVGFLFLRTKYYCVCGLRPFDSGSRFWSYTVRDHLALREKQGVDVVTAALSSVRNALQKPETVYDLRRPLLTSRPWVEQPGHLPTKRRTITQPFKAFKVVTVRASLGANALMFTVRLIPVDVAYQGISPGLVAANAAAETLGVSK